MVKAKSDEEGSEEKGEEQDSQKVENRNVSIKGVSRELYKRVNEIAHETGKTVGEITNDAYKVFASTIDGARSVSKSFITGALETGFQVVANLKELEISGEDLKDFKRKVIFRNIDKLELKDVTTKDIEEKVQGFVRIGELKIPHDVRKAAILTRADYVSKIIQK